MKARTGLEFAAHYSRTGNGDLHGLGRPVVRAKAREPRGTGEDVGTQPDVVPTSSALSYVDGLAQVGGVVAALL
ncbi:hypothetical protein GCM10018963_50840 [Saccharothrix longispora]